MSHHTALYFLKHPANTGLERIMVVKEIATKTNKSIPNLTRKVICLLPNEEKPPTFY